MLCLSVFEQRRSVCVHCPTASAGNKKTPARHFGCWLSKSRREKYGRLRRGKKYPSSPKIYLFWLPASLKLPVRDFKMAPPLPAREWARPCQNVFDGKTQTEKFPPLSPFPRPHCFSHFLCRYPPACRLSFTAHGKGSSSSPVELLPKCCLMRRDQERKGIALFLFTVVSPSLPFAGAVPEFSVSVRYLPVIHKSISH